MNGMEAMRGAGPLSDEWLGRLRERFISIARRRVAADAVEDVVQDALRVVIERGIPVPGALAHEGEPMLAYCFQVLRNVIGNHYQKERVQQRRREPGMPDSGFADPAPVPLESVASKEAVRIVGECIASMTGADAACGRYLRRLADGAGVGELAREERLAEAVLYRRVYRCRIKLRSLLARRGVMA
jgi:DNA-directed RNA polymerase specialized sigma24 family protein